MRQPVTSLREQVACALSPFVDAVSALEYAHVDAVLAVMRERIEALPSASPPGPIVKPWLFKADVLALFEDETLEGASSGG